MANTLNITSIPAPRVPFIDERTGLMSREWYRFFLNLFLLTGSGSNPTTLEELQLGPPNQPDLTELFIQINKDIAPQYEDQSGDFLATLDTAQLMSMMARFENAEAAIQGAYLQPVVQTGTIASYNLNSSPTAGGVAYGTGSALAVSAAGTLGQVLTSGGANAPTWATGGTVTSVTGTAPVVSSGGATPAISMAAATTSVNGYLTSTDWTTFNNKGSGSVTSVAQSFTGGLISVAGSPITTSGTLALTVAGTSGGVPYFSSASTWATSAALAASALVIGGGAGAAPATTTTGTGVVTALGVNTGTAGAFVVNGGALGTPSSGTVTNLTGTASININGTVGATTAAAGKFTTLSAIDAQGIIAVESTTATNSVYAQFKNGGGTSYVGADTSTGSVFSSGAYGFTIFNAANSATTFWTNAAERMRISSTGQVGIGLSPSYQLQLSTDSAAKPGVGGLWTVVSDERIKADIVPANLDRCYEIVKSVPLKYFGFAPGVYTDNQINDKHNLGWIAQDVQKVFKNAVSVTPFTPATGDVIEDCLDLNGGQMHAALYGAVQALMEKVEAQASRIAALEAKQ